MVENSVLALAIEETSTYSVRVAIDYLKEERGVENVALIGASVESRSDLRLPESTLSR